MCSIKQKSDGNEQMHLHCRPFWWPCGRLGATLLILPNAACSRLPGSCWMPPLGKYLLCIALAATRGTATMDLVAPAAWARARPRLRAQRRSWTRPTSFSGQIAGAQLRGLVIMHGLIALFLGVIACFHCRVGYNRQQFSPPTVGLTYAANPR